MTADDDIAARLAAYRQVLDRAVEQYDHVSFPPVEAPLSKQRAQSAHLDDRDLPEDGRHRPWRSAAVIAAAAAVVVAGLVVITNDDNRGIPADSIVLTIPATPVSLVLTVAPLSPNAAPGYENDSELVTAAFHQAAEDPLVIQLLGPTLHLVRAMPFINVDDPDGIALQVKTPQPRILPPGTPAWKGFGESSNKPPVDVRTTEPSWPSTYFEIFLRGDRSVRYITPHPASLIERDDSTTPIGSLCKIRFATASTVLQFMADAGQDAGTAIGDADRFDLLARLNGLRTETLRTLELPDDVAPFAARLDSDIQRLVDALVGDQPITNADLSWWFDFEHYPGYDAWTLAAEQEPECLDPSGGTAGPDRPAPLPHAVPPTTSIPLPIAPPSTVVQG